MPANVPPELEDKFKRCKEKLIADGKPEESAYAICYAAVVEGKADALDMASKHGFSLAPREISEVIEYFSAKFYAIKAVGEYELDVLAVPFNSRDSDGQWFDDRTDIMPDAFRTPLTVYQHGIKQGASGMQDKPLVIGRAVEGSLEKCSDGWHVRVVLDRTLAQVKAIMDAVKSRMVAVSSGTVDYLARLEIGGKFVRYDKNRPGRIAVWPLAEVSLWEMGNGNMRPANREAFAAPALKSLYEQAGLIFPDLSENDETRAGKASRIARLNLQKQARRLISTFNQE